MLLTVHNVLTQFSVNSIVQPNFHIIVLRQIHAWLTPMLVLRVVVNENIIVLNSMPVFQVFYRVPLPVIMMDNVVGKKAVIVLIVITKLTIVKIIKSTDNSRVLKIQQFLHWLEHVALWERNGVL